MKFNRILINPMIMIKKFKVFHQEQIKKKFQHNQIQLFLLPQHKKLNNKKVEKNSLCH